MAKLAAPPRARGSTYKKKTGYQIKFGSPACAGIDHSACPGSLRCQWLPRVRGDRPISSHKPGIAILAPPRARGSTVLTAVVTLLCRGSPACAGIDLRT